MQIFTGTLKSRNGARKDYTVEVEDAIYTDPQERARFITLQQTSADAQGKRLVNWKFEAKS